MAPRVWKDVDELLRYLAANWPFDWDDPFEPKLISPNAKLGDGDAPLHLVPGWDDVLGIRLLVKAGAHIDEPGDMGYTPLGTAIQRGSVAASRLLLRLGASPNIVNEFGQTPYDIAMRSDQDDLKRLFHESAA